ncbi:MAG: helix-hairpin-helix domain-containing protein [Bacteroidetes bacterium]|nr:helix-hairpin-helix domain-containing protein [Bacteroidota bacterium]
MNNRYKKQSPIRLSLSKKNQRGLLLILAGMGIYWFIPVYLKGKSNTESPVNNYKVLNIKYIDTVVSKKNELVLVWKTFNNSKRQNPQKWSPNKATIQKPVVKKMVDLNIADSIDLIKLPGIGPVLSARIVKYREKLGGFHSVAQLKEIYGMPDSTYQKISTQLELPDPIVKKIAINQADEKTIAMHPYVEWKEAKLIVRYREANGYFNSSEQLAACWGLEKKKLEKLLPYLSFTVTPTQ